MPTTQLTINRNATHQNIIGFGGAFTDSTGINVASLSPEVGKLLIDNYFAADGIEYNMGRVPIGGADFSPRAYTYDDDHDGDFDLEHWALTEEDLKYKVTQFDSCFALTLLVQTLV